MYAAYQAIDLVLKIFEFALIARVIVSWLPISKDNRIIDLLYAVTEPVLAPIRNMLSRSRFMSNSVFSMMDFSPVVAFILIGLLRSAIIIVFSMFMY